MSKAAAIVYGELSGIVRRIVVTDAGIEKLAGHHGDGESIIILNADEVVQAGVPSLTRAIELVEAKRGKPSDNPRVVILDEITKEITGAALADPVIDVVLGKRLVRHPIADVGWKLDKERGLYVEPFTIEIIPAGTVGEDGRPSEADVEVTSGGRIADLSNGALVGRRK